MKKVVLILSIACLTFTGMAQIQQREVRNPLKKGTIHKWESIRKDRKANTGLNNPKIQKAIKMRLDSVISSFMIGNTDAYKNFFFYSNNECVKMEVLYGEWDENRYVRKKYIDLYSGNVREVISFEWDSTTQAWIELSKSRYTDYSYSDSITEKIREDYDYDNQTWAKIFKYEYAYDDNGNQTMNATYIWDDVNTLWIGLDKYEYAYDDNSSQTMNKWYLWNEVNNQWEIMSTNVYTHSYQYDENNNVIEAIMKDENGNNLRKTKYAYNDNGNQTMYAEYGWDNVNNQWIGAYKSEYVYDENYSLSDLLIPEDYWFDYEAMILEEKSFSWDEDLEDWSHGTTTTYHYSSQNVFIKEISNTDNIKMYPNPVQNTLQIQSSATIEQVSIYDISGRMLRQIANPSQEINVSDLANGIYLVKVNTGEGESIRKIMKQ